MCYGDWLEEQAKIYEERKKFLKYLDEVEEWTKDWPKWKKEILRGSPNPKNS